MSNIIFMFDFDGTLASIVENPEKAFLSAGVRQWLKRLSMRDDCKVAVVTGRSLRDIRKRVGIKNVIYASNHGMEVYHEGRYLLRRCGRYKKPLKALEKELAGKLSHIPGVYVENKDLSVAIHLRRVKKCCREEVKRIVKAAVEPWLDRYKLQLTEGKMLLEARPLSWDKGKAVLWIWSRLAPKHLPVYIGDDVTDEDAFLALRPYGLTVRMGRKKETRAEYRCTSIAPLMRSMNYPAASSGVSKTHKDGSRPKGRGMDPLKKIKQPA